MNREIPVALSDQVVMEEGNLIQLSFFAFDNDGFINGDPGINLTLSPGDGALGDFSEPNIEGLVINLKSISAGGGKRYEIRNALKRFKESGKKIIVYSVCLRSKSKFRIVVDIIIY